MTTVQVRGWRVAGKKLQGSTCEGLLLLALSSRGLRPSNLHGVRYVLNALGRFAP
jgi:hypothetical protein